MGDQAWRRSKAPGRVSGEGRDVVQRIALPGRKTLTEAMIAPVQRKAGATAGDPRASSPPSGGGRPLPAPVRAKMEGFFARDFSAVRVHEGHPGVTYPDSVIPLSGDTELVTKQYGHPGLILYYTRRRQRQRQQQPSRERVIEVLLALGLSLGLLIVVLAALVDPEPASKLALAGLSVVMIGALLEALGMKEADQPPQA